MKKILMVNETAFFDENDVITSCELNEEDLGSVSGGSITAFLVLVAGISTMAANNVTPAVVRDATIINGAYALYKITGKIKYINTSKVNAAQKRMEKWSSKNKLDWNDLLDVIKAG